MPESQEQESQKPHGLNHRPDDGRGRDSEGSEGSITSLSRIDESSGKGIQNYEDDG